MNIFLILKTKEKKRFGIKKIVTKNNQTSISIAAEKFFIFYIYVFYNLTDRPTNRKQTSFLISSRGSRVSPKTQLTDGQPDGHFELQSSFAIKKTRSNVYVIHNFIKCFLFKQFLKRNQEWAILTKDLYWIVIIIIQNFILK